MHFIWCCFLSPSCRTACRQRSEFSWCAPRQTALLGLDKRKLGPKKIFEAVTCLITVLMRNPGWPIWEQIWPRRSKTFVCEKALQWHLDLIGENNNYAANLLSCGSSAASIGSCLELLESELRLLSAIKVTGSYKSGLEVLKEPLCEVVGAEGLRNHGIWKRGNARPQHWHKLCKLQPGLQ